MAHAPLLRNNTAPVFQNQNGIGGLPNTMSNAPRASQLSGSTAFTSAGSINSFASTSTITPAQNGGPVIATANIINQKADASRSLYQICMSLKQRLAQVPGFDPYLQELDPTDPVESLWSLFRTGYPFLDIYNALQPEKPLEIDGPNAAASESKKSKIAIFKFIQACLKELGIPSAECFVISDVLGNDTTGFVKTTQVVNLVLDLAEQRGLLLQLQPYPEDDMPKEPGSKLSYRDHIIKELVDTERKYVQDLENLYDLKSSLETKGIITGDTIHQIFLNINAILDFQRRFLIRVETTNSMPQAVQQWGAPFVTYEESFDIYRPFIANQRKAAQVAGQVFDQIKASGHPVAADFNTLDGFLLKPMQRLVKYPLLLKDLLKKSEDESIKADLAGGIEAAERVLSRANEEVNRDLLDEALDDLRNRVDDWKNHRVEQFGRLLMHGVYTVVTGKSEQEKDYEIYLFECILLCCKEISANKSKDKKDKTRSTGPKIRNKNARLQLKGRIFMTNVTDVVSLSKPGSYSVQIWWKGDPGVENFMIKYTNEEQMKKWANALELQRKDNAPKASTSPDSAAPDFAWTREHGGKLENPYLNQQDDDDEDEMWPPASAPAQFPMPTQSTGGTMLPRNASSTSLRQRAATGESLAGMVRAPPPRFPLPQPPAPLNVQTQMPPPGASSPGARGGDSYFSPVAESPVSSRTSTASGMFPNPNYQFPKSLTPQPGWEDPNQRYTAPAMPRAPSRDGAPQRNPRGPSLPAMASNSQSAAQQQRSRSYSTPDINGPGGIRRTQGGTPVPTVPSIPAHLHPAHDNNIPRSQTGSPRMNDLPMRANTQSPGAQRERQYGHQQSGSYGGSMSQFPAQPIYPRQGTPNSIAHDRQLSIDAAASMNAVLSPPLGTGVSATQSNPLASPDLPIPTQLKVKVNFVDSGNYVTLVVAFNITYQSLIDRIDAKLARFTNSSISKGMLKLRYQDEDGDFVTIASDDDIQIAFIEWREGGVGEIELFCVGDTA
ncbi:Rho guanine nucleotide exchange factor scd1 [Colletotrichum siamense]|uniref:Rho guanine nucleotide exchange factor scd1 n=1 Tax=Colletotrichum siamense TaxID=690259 RepID=UPI001872818F|nr:Rho guanine nucleotide exchange factor scd1 [Colletotrichum siamense]KAF5484345.1 Rho guanine nucleotide exchange factor scd1 [Colletotrichum siamense]